MFRVIKTLLIWLFVVALPVQGFAATTKAACSPARHVSLAPIAAQALHADGAHDHHGHDSNYQVAVDDMTADRSSGADASGQHAEHKSAYCSACSTCCVGAALMFSGLDWGPLVHAVETLKPLPSPLFSGFIPTGLERPPRHFSA